MLFNAPRNDVDNIKISKQVGLSVALNCIATEMRSDELRIGVLNRIIEWNCIHHAIHSSYN